MAGLFFGNRKEYDFYGIELKNANVCMEMVFT